MNQVEANIGYWFKNKALLEEALTHPSVQGKPNYQRLEYLGDSTLHLAISSIVFEKFPAYNESDLSKKVSYLVKNRNIAKLGYVLGVGEAIIKGKGQVITENMVADSLEALIGAVFLDSGYEEVRKVIDRLFGDGINKLDSAKQISYDPKTELQERVQRLLKITPTYEVVDEHGPEHAKVFVVKVYAGNLYLGVGEGPNKKIAEKRAAKYALGN